MDVIKDSQISIKHNISHLLNNNLPINPNKLSAMLTCDEICGTWQLYYIVLFGKR